MSAECLEDRIVLITGASGGIGRSLALACVTAGAQVIAVGRDRARLDDLHAEAADRSERLQVRVADLTAPAATESLTRGVGRVDVLVCCAAAPLRHSSVLQSHDATWTEQFLMNVFVPSRLVTAFGRLMVEAGSGSVIFVSSVASRVPQPLLAPYSASKAALDSLMRTTAIELGEHGIRSNSVAPGLVETERTRHLLDEPGVGVAQRRATPLGRLAKPDDIADVVVWLASDAARFVTGQVVTIDGGRTAGLYTAESV